MQAVVHAPGEGERVGGPSAITIKATGDDTGGSFYLGEAVIEPGFPGPPAHVHERLHDMFYVLEGTLTVRLGSETRELEHATDKAGRCNGKDRRFEIVYIDDTLELETLTASVNSVSTASEVGDRFITERPSGEYLVVNLAVTNRTNSPKDFSPYQEQAVLEVRNKLYKEDFNAENTPSTGSFLWKGEAIGPDISQSGTVIFDVPPEVADEVMSDNTDAGINILEFGSNKSDPIGSIILREQ